MICHTAENFLIQVTNQLSSKPVRSKRIRQILQCCFWRYFLLRRKMTCSKLCFKTKKLSKIFQFLNGNRISNNNLNIFITKHFHNKNICKNNLWTLLEWIKNIESTHYFHFTQMTNKIKQLIFKKLKFLLYHNFGLFISLDV